MIPYGRQHIDKRGIDAVTEVLQGELITQGPRVAEFEEHVAKYVGAEYGVAVNSGTAALHLAYRVAGLGEGDEAIVTPNTFVATTNMLLAIGAVPVFCDIRLDTYNTDETQIESHITPRTKAIVSVDFAGHPCVYEKINAIAREHDLLVIEDGAHALGARYQDQPVGSLADITTFSFHPVKPITTAEGGMLVTNDKGYAEHARALRSHGVAKDGAGVNVMTDLGYNYRMPDVLAALGHSQMDRLDEFIGARRTVAGWYHDALSDCEDVILPEEAAGAASGWHLYVIRTKDADKRDGLREYLRENGIGVNFHYPAVYDQPYYQSNGYAGIKLPNMEIYQSSCLTLPCHPSLKEEEVQHIGELVKEYYERQ